MQLAPFYGCGEQDPEEEAPFPRPQARQRPGRVLGLLIQCSLADTRLSARRGETAGRPASPLPLLPAEHYQRCYCPWNPTPLTLRPWDWENGPSVPSSASRLALPGPPPPLSPLPQDLSPQSGRDRMSPAVGLAAPPLPPSPQAKGSTETGESRPEPSGALTCAPALGLQGVARIELLDEGVAVFPTDDAAGQETGCSWTTMCWQSPSGLPGPRGPLAPFSSP